MITISKTQFALICLAGFLIGLFSTALGYFLPENATEAMKSVITADAALVGFMGVITVFIMTSFQNEARRIEDNEIRASEAAESYRKLIQNGHCSSFELALAKKNSMILESFGEKRQLIDYFANNIFRFVVASVLLLIISILIALLGMSPNGTIRFAGIMFSILFMGLGIFIMLILLNEYNKFFSRLRKLTNT